MTADFTFRPWREADLARLFAREYDAVWLRTDIIDTAGKIVEQSFEE